MITTEDSPYLIGELQLAVAVQLHHLHLHKVAYCIDLSKLVIDHIN